MVITAEGKVHFSLLIFASGPTAVNPNLTRWLMNGSFATPEAICQYSLCCAGYLRAIRGKSRVAPGAGEDYTYTIRLNGVNTALTTLIEGAAATENQADDRIAFAQGDELSIQLETSALAAATNHNVTVLIEITPP